MGKVIELGKITELTILAWPAQYEKREDGHYCTQCGSKVKATTCYVSVHLKIFEPLCAITEETKRRIRR